MKIFPIVTYFGRH